MRKSIAWTLATLALVAVLVAAVIFGVHLVKSSSKSTLTAECTVPAATVPTGQSSPVDLAAVQLQHASTINAVGMSRGLPQAGQDHRAGHRTAGIVACATCRSGDRDSRRSVPAAAVAGLGQKAQLLDPVYASGKFYDALVEVTGWQKLSVTKAAQSVQYSAFPDAYAKWEDEATTLAIALGGASPLGLGCVAGCAGAHRRRTGPTGVAGAPKGPPALGAVLAAAQAELGGVKVMAVDTDPRDRDADRAGISTDRAAGHRGLVGRPCHQIHRHHAVSVDGHKWADQLGRGRSRSAGRPGRDHSRRLMSAEGRG